MRTQRIIAAGAVVLVLAGSGGCARTNAASPSSVSVPPQAYHLASDGSVPWVNDPIQEADLYRPSTPPSPPSEAAACHAKQLSATLASWIKPNYGGETPRGFDAHISRLYGYVDIRNTSATWCTLRGEAPTTMVAGGKTIPMLYTHDISEEARAREIMVAPDGRASLRLDWDGPFCVDLTGPVQAVIELPHDGGTLRAPITATDRPACNTWAVKPNVKAALSAGGFSEAVDPSPAGPSSVEPSPVGTLPVQQLTADATGPDVVRPNERFGFRVTLSNPTGTPIALQPCPAYGMQLHATRDELGEPVTVQTFYQLNCRPVAAVPASGSLMFQMQAVVPAALVPGRQLHVTWSLTPRQQTPEKPVRAELALPVA